MATSQSITDTQEYKESFQLLGFQSKDELSSKISKIEDIVTGELKKKKRDGKEDLEKFSQHLAVYVNNLRTVGIGELDEETAEGGINEAAAFSGHMDRKKLKDVTVCFKSNSLVDECKFSETAGEVQEDQTNE